MKPEELKIGNYVNTENGVKRVSNISVDGHCYFLEIHVKPINLDEEWLKSFGFLSNGVYLELNNDRFKLSVAYYDGYNINYSDNQTDYSTCGFFYVHEFQNIIYDLTKVMLTRKGE